MQTPREEASDGADHLPAELLGLYIALMGIEMLVKPEATRALVVAFLDQRALLYLVGALRVLAGLAIVLGSDDREPEGQTAAGRLSARLSADRPSQEGFDSASSLKNAAPEAALTAVRR